MTAASSCDPSSSRIVRRTDRAVANEALDDAVAGITGSCTPHGDRLGPNDGAVAHVREPQEASDVRVGRLRPELVGGTGLYHVAVTHHCDAVAERESLGLIVRDEERCHAELLEQCTEVLEQPLSKRAIERAERLVEEQHARLRRERSCESDALLLAAGKRRDRASLEPVQPDEFEQLAHLSIDLMLRASPRMRRPNATLPATSMW